MKEPIFEFNKDTGFSKCIIKDKELEFIGTAQCHPDDMDMNSHFTGMTIAEMRAELAAFRHIRDNEIIPELRALKELHGTMKHSKRFNPKSYENVMLQRAIRRKEFELKEIRTIIAEQVAAIHSFIFEKEKCYQGMRRNRVEAAHEQGQN
jgi:hypothetical protein